MKRCPRCNRSYSTDTQKFCTHDGGLLVPTEAGQETVRIDTSQFDPDAPTKTISPELAAEVTGSFDPFKTVMARPEDTAPPSTPDTTDASTPSTTLQPPSGPAPEPKAGAGPSRSETLPPSPVEKSQPTMRLTGVGTGSIASSAPQVSSGQLPLPPTATTPARKKSRMPLVLGILVVLLVLGAGLAVAAYIFGPGIVSSLQARRQTPAPAPSAEPTPSLQATPGNVVNPTPTVSPLPAYSPPADAIEFVNSKTNLDGKLAEHYVDFSFYYPDRWVKDPTAGVRGARNFAMVERRLPPDFTQENFAVSWNSSAAPVAENRGLFHTLVESLSTQFERQFPGYQKVSEGETKVGVYDGYEFRFEGFSLNTAKGDLKLWGRVVFLPPRDGGKNGVTLLMLATSLAPELKSVRDVGVKGELPMLLASFRYGKN